MEPEMIEERFHGATLARKIAWRLPWLILAVDDTHHLHLHGRLAVPRRGITESNGRRPGHSWPSWQPPLPRIIDLHHWLESWPRLDISGTFLLPDLATVIRELHLGRVRL